MIAKDNVAFIVDHHVVIRRGDFTDVGVFSI
jgi:hypothetical protein